VSSAAEVPSDGDRAASQRAHEQSMGEVSDVLLNLEHTLNRAKRARTVLKKSGANRNAELAIDALIADLTRVHKRLMQDTYYAGDAVRLI